MIQTINAQTTTTLANEITLYWDSQTPDLCFAVENRTNYICNNTESMTLDGTKDYEYFIIIKPPIEENASNIQKAEYFLTEPLTLIIGIGSFLIAMIVGVIIVIAFAKWAMSFI